MTTAIKLKKSTDLDQLCINTIRTLSLDAVEKAIPGIRGCLLGWHRQLMCFGQSFFGTIRGIRTGSTATDFC